MELLGPDVASLFFCLLRVLDILILDFGLLVYKNYPLFILQFWNSTKNLKKKNFTDA